MKTKMNKNRNRSRNRNRNWKTKRLRKTSKTTAYNNPFYIIVIIFIKTRLTFYIKIDLLL
jgi:hypothetical protein